MSGRSVIGQGSRDAFPAAWDWRDSAACLGYEPEMIFPIGAKGPNERQRAAANRICRHCSVTQSLLDWALRKGAEGVWGGLDQERRRLRRRLRVDRRLGMAYGAR
jgi:WhiB family transcriptional regulator, redox-sensing transcriptional regulator